MGRVDYGRKSSEQGNVKFRRSLYFVKDMKAGDVITEDCVRSVRPGFGLSPKHLRDVLGSALRIDVQKNTPTKMQLLQKPNK
jgi:N-acetylneuraminate synthase